ncbi:TIGR03643 family protein [Cognataquiflexum rubidum]|uniref:TIGR03643 family protein n=1 Tax=Cognataquiflexum rubidum TaxID=2922273 RepID=UPI001F14767B|nr:TIGR03643 family protein [Cognataquiflexum rubidum]MCH6236638.1 TIGR03643 family protein [Cognataquiflexum rubidum]
MEIIDKDRIIEMAWEDRTPFEAIKNQFGIPEQEVIVLMRKELKHSSFQLWRKRVTGRKTKHPKKYGIESEKFKCDLQRPITFNKISKRK